MAKAWEVLGDEVRRRAYDAERAAQAPVPKGEYHLNRLKLKQNDDLERENSSEIIPKWLIFKRKSL